MIDMKRSVFYSWQTDSPAATNRNLIQDALSRALRAIRRDEEAQVQPVLDRDTAGVPGTPAIAESIFAKIAESDVFVADVTIVNADAQARWTANPNVLIELGFAISVLGWQRIILVQNKTYGGPERLPFDLRARLVVAYELAENDAAARVETRALLQGRLEAALRTSLQDSVFQGRHAGRSVSLWWGHWTIEAAGAAFGGHLFIWDVGPAGFQFDLTIFSGAHNGAICGFARIVSSDLAYARMKSQGNQDVCEISFLRSVDDGRRRITIEEKSHCGQHHGAGVTFTGAFVREYEGLFDSGALDEIDLRRLYSITGKYFSGLTACFQMVASLEDIPDGFQATALTGAPRGLFTIMEAIVMRGERGELWAAYIDGDNVRYFTTQQEYRRRLPLTFERWRERFPKKEVVYISEVDSIPSFDL